MSRAWGVQPPVFAALGGAVALGLGWSILAGTAVDRLVAIAVVVAALLAALACWSMRRRLTADTTGLVLRGPGGTRQVAWSEVIGIEIVRRSHLGIGSSTLEVDLDDDGILVLGRFDLGTDPADVARELKALRAG